MKHTRSAASSFAHLCARERVFWTMRQSARAPSCKTHGVSAVGGTAMSSTHQRHGAARTAETAANAAARPKRLERRGRWALTARRTVAPFCRIRMQHGTTPSAISSAGRKSACGSRAQALPAAFVPVVTGSGLCVVTPRRSSHRLVRRRSAKEQQRNALAADALAEACACKYERAGPACLVTNAAAAAA
jgi:hypothetical protein